MPDVSQHNTPHCSEALYSQREKVSGNDDDISVALIQHSQKEDSETQITVDTRGQNKGTEGLHTGVT